MSKPNLFGNVAAPKAPTSSAVVAKKSTGNTKPVNLKVKGTDLSLEGLPVEEVLYIQAMLGESNLLNRIKLGVYSAEFGVPNYMDSPLYKALPRTMIRKLNIILRTMSGEMPSDFKRYDKEKKQYIEQDIKYVTKPIEPENLSVSQDSQPFPSYNIYLGPYLGGRYEHGTSKPAYSSEIMTSQVNYFERPPMKKSQADIYLADPLKTLMDNPETFTEEELNTALELYQGVKKFDFSYTLSSKALDIFEFLQEVYIKELMIKDDDDGRLSAHLIPSKLVNGTTIYIDDSCLKNGDLFDLATKLNTTAIFDFITDAECGSYKIHYIALDKLCYILNSVLGEDNWTVETSSEVTWNDNRIVRGYYVDKLGNFKYGQIVIPKKSDFGNSDADKEKTGQSKLTRTLITQVFKTLHGLSDEEKKQVDEYKSNIAKTGVKKAIDKWRGYNKQDAVKLLEQTDVKPIKRITDAQEDRIEKRYLDWETGSVKPVETKETKETKDKEDFKGIEKSKNGVTIEEKD